MENRILSILGLVRRAGKLSFGFDSVKDAIKCGHASLVVLAADLSQGSQDEMRFLAERRGVPTVQIGLTMEAIAPAIGRKGMIGILSVNDKGFAGKLLSLTQDQGGVAYDH